MPALVRPPCLRDFLPGSRDELGAGPGGEIADYRGFDVELRLHALKLRPLLRWPVHHTVRTGDTLYSVARRYGTTVAAVQRLNDLRSTDLREGQRLRVR